MSEKKDIELECFNRVVKYGIQQHGQTKRIISRLMGCDIKRDEEERPDFVKYVKSLYKNQKGTIIGIEHFRVDKCSFLKKNNNIASASMIHNRNTSRLYNNYKEQVLEKDEISDKLLEDFTRLISDSLESEQNTNYNTFIEAFDYALRKHLKSIDVYRNNLIKLSKNENIELGLLIEVHSNFSKLFLNDKKGIRKNKSGMMPMFEEIVSRLEKIDFRKVNFIILCLENPLINGQPKVLAFSTRNIRKDLKNQNITIYEYAGSDLKEKSFKSREEGMKIKATFTKNAEQVDMNFEYNSKDINEEQLLLDNLHGYYLAYIMKQQKKNFVTTKAIQWMMYVLDNQIVGWENKKNIMVPIIKDINMETITKKSEEFDEFIEND